MTAPDPPERDGGSSRASAAGVSGHDPAEESPSARVNRQFLELLTELRIAVPGVQFLFAFLLVVPFNAGFARLDGLERASYLVTLIAAALSLVFLVGPAAYHRGRSSRAPSSGRSRSRTCSSASA